MRIHQYIFTIEGILIHFRHPPARIYWNNVQYARVPMEAERKSVDAGAALTVT